MTQDSEGCEVFEIDDGVVLQFFKPIASDRRIIHKPYQTTLNILQRHSWRVVRSGRDEANNLCAYLQRHPESGREIDDVLDDLR